MEAYNILIMQNYTPGLRIMQAEAYKHFAAGSSGAVFEDCGEFHSEITVDRLANAVYKNMKKDFAGMDISRNLVAVDASAFSHGKAGSDIKYVIRENDGARIYIPKLHSHPRFEELQYCVIGAIVFTDIFPKDNVNYSDTSLILNDRLDPMFKYLNERLEKLSSTVLCKDFSIHES